MYQSSTCVGRGVCGQLIENNGVMKVVILVIYKFSLGSHFCIADIQQVAILVCHVMVLIFSSTTYSKCLALHTTEVMIGTYITRSLHNYGLIILIVVCKATFTFVYKYINELFACVKMSTQYKLQLHGYMGGRLKPTSAT